MVLGGRVQDGAAMNQYLAMPIGRTHVVLCYEPGSSELLCVMRKSSTRKVRLNRKWWQRAETFLDNSLKPALEGACHGA